MGKKRIPDVAIAATSSKLEIPIWQEGFDELYDVYICDGKFVLKEWKEQST